MPLPAILDLSLIKATAKSGTIFASRRSTATSATSCSTNSGNTEPGNHYALLAKLQGIPIHAPPGLCPIHAGAWPITKTQVHTEHKAKKEAMAKAAEGKKLAVTVRLTKVLAKKQEKQELLLSTAKTKAAKAVAKAKELHAATDKTLVRTLASNDKSTTTSTNLTPSGNRSPPATLRMGGIEVSHNAIEDGIWPGSQNVSLLTHFVSCHFSGDWMAYLPFVHWADTQLMEHPDSKICLDDWLSLKSVSGGDGGKGADT
jgi:hypothetical protein